MQKYFLFLFLVLLTLSGCKKDEVVPPIITGQDGQIVLKIDRDNAPQNVTTVTAYLTRTGYSTITNSLNLLTDSTADLTLNSIPIGPWHLKVDAADSLGVVQYTGETDVTVIENQTIQITLTLVPVTSGVGNIYLYVTWGTTNTWIDYPFNPIFKRINNGFEINGVYQGKVLFDDNKYKMWFNGLNPGGMGVIEYAESNDGINWTRPVNHPVLYPGNFGTWDSESISLPVVIKDGSQFKMYYHGRASLYGQWHIGLATSSDGINWTKHPTPVLYGLSGWEYQVSPSDIIKKDGVYYLYYCGIIYNNYPVEHRIGLATSTDGINFTRNPQNPILHADQGWENGFIMYPSVIFENGIFKMVFVNNNGSGFGEAISNDGFSWTKSPSNPFFTLANTANHWTPWIGYPYYRKFTDGYRIYYGGIENTGYFAIGLIKK